MNDAAIPSQLLERIKTSISSTLKQHPEGLSPKQLFDLHQNDYNKQDMAAVLTEMYNANKSLLGKDKKLRL